MWVLEITCLQGSIKLEKDGKITFEEVLRSLIWNDESKTCTFFIKQRILANSNHYISLSCAAVSIGSFRIKQSFDGLLIETTW